jgi:hypothetical protein
MIFTWTRWQAKQKPLVAVAAGFRIMCLKEAVK